MHVCACVRACVCVNLQHGNKPTSSLSTHLLRDRSLLDEAARKVAGIKLLENVFVLQIPKHRHLYAAQRARKGSEWSERGEMERACERASETKKTLRTISLRLSIRVSSFPDVLDERLSV